MHSFTFRSSAFALLCLLLVLSAGCKSTTVPQRQALYVTCNKGEHVLAYLINHETGELDEIQRLELPGQPGPFALTDDGKNAYAALRNPSQIQPMTRDTQTGELSLLEPSPVSVFPTYLDIDATGNYAVIAAYGAGIVQSFKINEDRSVRPEPLLTIKTDKTAHACLIDPSNRFVYIPHTTPNAIYQFRFDEKTGRLTPIQPLVVKGGGTPGNPQGPRHYAYHPTLERVYMVNELDSSVGAYTWDQDTGKLQRYQSLSTLPERFDGRNTCADIHITPDGKYLYASNRGHDSIAAYKLDRDGRMMLIDTFPTEPVPREFAIDLTGRFVYVAGLRSNKLAAYTIEQATGKLKRFATYDTPEGPIWVEPSALD